MDDFRLTTSRRCPTGVVGRDVAPLVGSVVVPLVGSVVVPRGKILDLIMEVMSVVMDSSGVIFDAVFVAAAPEMPSPPPTTP